MTGRQPLPALLRCRCKRLSPYTSNRPCPYTSNRLSPYTSNVAACSLHAEAGGSRRGGNGVADEAAQLRLRLQHRPRCRRMPCGVCRPLLQPVPCPACAFVMHRASCTVFESRLHRRCGVIMMTTVVHLQAVGQEPGTQGGGGRRPGAAPPADGRAAAGVHHIWLLRAAPGACQIRQRRRRARPARHRPGCHRRCAISRARGSGIIAMLYTQILIHFPLVAFVKLST